MQHIVEEIMEELQQTTFRIQGDIFYTETSFPAYAIEVALDPFMAYKSMSDPDTTYLHESMN